MNDLTPDRRMYWVVADVLLLAVQLPTSKHLPAPAELKQRLIDALDTMVGKGRQRGVSDQELAEARYALTAFLDEQIFKSHWAGRSEWMNEPLQLVLYRERGAGEHFFVRLRALLRSGKRLAALEVYYLCLALGFRGVYEQNGDLRGLASFTEAARRQLEGALPDASKLAPNAQPRDRGFAARHSNAVVYAVLGGCVVLIGLTLAALAWSTDSKLQEAVNVIAPVTAR